MGILVAANQGFTAKLSGFGALGVEGAGARCLGLLGFQRLDLSRFSGWAFSVYRSDRNKKPSYLHEVP